MDTLKVNTTRLIERIEEMGSIGAGEDGGVCRLALTPEDREARDLLKSWLDGCNAGVSIDRIGNMFGVREGTGEGPAVMAGSHLDTVISGGLYDGALGVLVALEILELLEEHDVRHRRPYAVANFTNEEGVRFTPGMMGSRAFASAGEDAGELLESPDVNGETTVGEALKQIGYSGGRPCGHLDVGHFLELHIEQGPVLENERIDTAAVESVQGIYWTEYTITGKAGHAGTTPIELRRDAGYAAARLNVFARKLAEEYGAAATAGFQEWSPNATNVIPERARLRIDLRHPEKDTLQKCQRLLDEFAREACDDEQLDFERRELIRVDPVQFDPGLVETIEKQAESLGISLRRMASGAGHDAMMMASVCPSAMIFVPSVGGISHNPEEFTREEHIEAGANLLLHTVLGLLDGEIESSSG